MTEYMHLVGAEDVARAASTMDSAASSLSRTVSYFGEWVQRFEIAVDKLEQLQREDGR